VMLQDAKLWQLYQLGISEQTDESLVGSSAPPDSVAR
jgi:hypothetical protein